MTGIETGLTGAMGRITSYNVCYTKLLRIPEIERAIDFEALFSLVAAALQGLSGVRDELVYLTALRIGLQAGFEPQRIYLHDEVRPGAAELVAFKEQESELRITSYNVCYTKLLRIPENELKLEYFITFFLKMYHK